MRTVCWLSGLLVVLATTNGLRADDEAKNAKQESAVKTHPVYGQTMKSLTGKSVDLARYQGKVLLIVNTASQCGATPQYAPLEELHRKYADRGLAVLGFPCNQFGRQEPGTEEEIAEFCQKNYGVHFDMFGKVDVNGEQAAPLFRFLTSAKTGLKEADQGPVKWNFEKFLIARDGRVVARFRTGVQPDSDQVVQAIEQELAREVAGK